MMTNPEKLYPLASLAQAEAQAFRLHAAKQYLAERGIMAAAIGSKFEYVRATGHVLGGQLRQVF